MKLINALEEKKFYLINEGLWKEIYLDEKKEEESRVNFILENNKIILTLKDNNKLEFEIKNNWIIEKSLLIHNSENNEKTKKNETISDSKEINSINNGNYEVENQIEPKDNKNKEKNDELLVIIGKEIDILISFFFFNKSLKESLNNSLKEENNLEKKLQIMEVKCYLINRKWIEELKAFFLYNKLCSYIEEQKISFEKINKENKSDIIKYIYDLMKKENNLLNKEDIEKEKNKFSHLSIAPPIKNIKNPENNIFPDEFYIINEEIYNKINESYFYLKNQEKQEENYYFFDNGKIVLKLRLILYNNELKYNRLLIGDITNEYLFIPEKIINYEEKDNNNLNVYESYNQLKKIKFFLEVKGKINQNKEDIKYKITNIDLTNKVKIVAETENNNDEIIQNKRRL